MLRVMKLFRNEEEVIISCSRVAYHNFYMMKMIHLWCSVGSTAGFVTVTVTAIIVHVYRLGISFHSFLKTMGNFIPPKCM